jgi:hypothetical protein
MNLLKSKSKIILKQLRDLSFSELVANLPEYAGREMIDRKKGELLAEDIYITSFSAINKIADKKLNKCFKQSDLDASQCSTVEDDSQENQDLKSLIELCLTLQEKVSSLEQTVKSQNDRINALETNSTTDKLNILNLQNRSMDQPEAGASGGHVKTKPGTLGAPSQADGLGSGQLSL